MTPDQTKPDQTKPDQTRPCFRTCLRKKPLFIAS